MAAKGGLNSWISFGALWGITTMLLSQKHHIEDFVIVPYYLDHDGRTKGHHGQRNSGWRQWRSEDS